MTFENLIVSREPLFGRITLNRAHAQNALTPSMVHEIDSALTDLENGPGRLVVIQGSGDWFCTGMDLGNLTRQGDGSALQETFRMYQEMLRRLTLYPKVTVSLVEGPALAGGVGLVSASDLVVATPRATFALSEAVWGLLPAMVLPYLIRRTGFQKAYWMTLTTQTVSAQQAEQMHLVDYLTEQPEATIGQLATRLSRIDTDTITSLKRLARELWSITPATEERTLEESVRLARSERVSARIRDFVDHARLPWEGSSEQ